MKLYYDIETNRHIDRNGEEIIETEAVEYEVADFDVVCAFMRDFHPAAKMAVISLWFGEDEDGRARFLAAIMKKHGEEIEEFFRQRALDGVFAPVIDEMDEDGKSIDGGAKRACGAE